MGMSIIDTPAAAFFLNLGIVVLLLFQFSSGFVRIALILIATEKLPLLYRVIIASDFDRDLSRITIGRQGPRVGQPTGNGGDAN
jgi:hypothetical protein